MGGAGLGLLSNLRESLEARVRGLLLLWDTTQACKKSFISYVRVSSPEDEEESEKGDFGMSNFLLAAVTIAFPSLNE